MNDKFKNWLAQYAGINNCFSSSGISYNDPDGISHTGSTGDVVNAFYVANFLGKKDVNIINNTNYNTVKTINGNNDITNDDVKFAYDNDGNPSNEAKYCYTSLSSNVIVEEFTITPSTTQILKDTSVDIYIKWKNNNILPITIQPGYYITTNDNDQSVYNSLNGDKELTAGSSYNETFTHIFTSSFLGTNKIEPKYNKNLNVQPITIEVVNELPKDEPPKEEGFGIVEKLMITGLAFGLIYNYLKNK